jgi:hypothetical protein
VIEITRALARQFRAVLRKLTPLHAGRGPRPAVVLHAGPDGLRLRAGYAQAALEYRPRRRWPCPPRPSTTAPAVKTPRS